MGEIDLLYQFGSSIGLGEVEVAQAIALHIQRDFVPSLDAIC